MNTTEILNNIIAGYELKNVYSEKTKQVEKIVDELIEILEEKATPEQTKILLELSNTTFDYAYEFFYDGVAFGFNLAKDMETILENPDSVFKERRAEEPPVEETNENALELIRKHKQNKQKKR